MSNFTTFSALFSTLCAFTSITQQSGLHLLLPVTYLPCRLRCGAFDIPSRPFEIPPFFPNLGVAGPKHTRRSPSAQPELHMGGTELNLGPSPPTINLYYITCLVIVTNRIWVGPAEQQTPLSKRCWTLKDFVFFFLERGDIPLLRFFLRRLLTNIFCSSPIPVLLADHSYLLHYIICFSQLLSIHEHITLHIATIFPLLFSLLLLFYHNSGPRRKSSWEGIWWSFTRVCFHSELLCLYPPSYPTPTPLSTCEKEKDEGSCRCIRLCTGSHFSLFPSAILRFGGM